MWGTTISSHQRRDVGHHHLLAPAVALFDHLRLALAAHVGHEAVHDRVHVDNCQPVLQRPPGEPGQAATSQPALTVQVARPEGA
jgi:hypothetical protein